LCEGATVYTIEGKRVGTVGKVNADYFVLCRQSARVDEEFRVPLVAVFSVQQENGKSSMWLSLNERDLEGWLQLYDASYSEFKSPFKRQTIHYKI
jgi:hypothetical protein